MTLRKLALLFAVSTMLAACAGDPTMSMATNGAGKQVQEQRWKMMVGKWYGSRARNGGGRVEWVYDRKPRGAYQATFRTTAADGAVSDDVEVGEWGVVGPIYFTIFKGWLREGRMVPNDPADPKNRDAYRIIALTEEELVYEHVVSGEKYRAKRVADAFEFPLVPK